MNSFRDLPVRCDGLSSESGRASKGRASIGSLDFRVDARLSSGGLQIGLQLLGRPYDDARLTEVAITLDSRLREPTRAEVVGAANPILA